MGEDNTTLYNLLKSVFFFKIGQTAGLLIGGGSLSPVDGQVFPQGDRHTEVLDFFAPLLVPMF